jgi:hypothetical protein
MRDAKLNELEKSYNSKLISRQEYEKKKEEIEKMPEQEEEEENAQRKPSAEIVEEEEKGFKKSDKVFIIGVVLVILIFAAIFLFFYFTKETPETIEDLHKLNFEGKLKPEEGYVYRDAYSFVRYDNLWYAQLMSPSGARYYNIQFRYGPKEVEDLGIRGYLNNELFNNATEYYVTFDPTGKDFSHIALAVGDFNQQMVNVFFKQPIAACDRNDTEICKNRPIVTCNSTDEVVLYIKEADALNLYYDNNCIVVEGSGLDLVRGVDRILYDFYKIIE